MPWVNATGVPILTFGGYAPESSLDNDEIWTTMVSERVRFHGSDNHNDVIIGGTYKEGKGPFWPDIPPGESWSHYKTNTTYSRLMASGEASVYNLDSIIKTQYFTSLYNKYNLTDNVTADQRVSGYPNFPNSRPVPELDPVIAAIIAPAGIMLTKYLSRKRKDKFSS